MVVNITINHTNTVSWELNDFESKVAYYGSNYYIKYPPCSNVKGWMFCSGVVPMFWGLIKSSLKKIFYLSDPGLINAQ